MKIYIMTDLEGVGGVVKQDLQTVSINPEYYRACEYLVEEVNAAVAGAFDAGATEVMVSDSHWQGFNIRMDLLDSRAACVTGSGRPSWMVGLEGFDAVVCIGLHAMSGTEGAVLDHTWDPDGWNNLWINGKLSGEFGLIAYMAGHYNIPVIFASGDDKLCLEAKTLVNSITVVETKKGLCRESAICYPLKQVRLKIKEGVFNALKNIKNVKTLKLESPVEMIVEYKNTRIVDGIKIINGRKLLNSKKIEYKGKDVTECFNLLF